MLPQDRSEKSFDPESRQAAANMSLSSEKSFDPELLHFEPSCASVASLHTQDLAHDAHDSDDTDAASDASFDPEKAPCKTASITSEQSFDPDILSQGTASVQSEESFDPESKQFVAGEGGVWLSSELSFDPQTLPGTTSQTSHLSFDAETDMQTEALAGAAHGSRSSIGSARSYDAERSVAGGSRHHSGGSQASHVSFASQASCSSSSYVSYGALAPLLATWPPCWKS
jgi:hypothetical protein